MTELERKQKKLYKMLDTKKLTDKDVVLKSQEMDKIIVNILKNAKELKGLKSTKQ